MDKQHKQRLPGVPDAKESEAHEEKLQQLFFAAMDLPPEDHIGFLERHCQKNSQLRADLEALLLQPDEQAGLPK